MTEIYSDKNKNAIKITCLTPLRLSKWLTQQPKAIQRWVQSAEFIAKPGQVFLMGDAKGQLIQVLFGLKDADDFWSVGALPRLLPKNTYELDNSEQFFNEEQFRRLHLAWGLGAYQFNAYVQRDDFSERLLYVKKADRAFLQDLVSSIYLIRDLINTPAADMGPEHLMEAAKAVASENKAKVSVIKGEALLRQNFPTIYAVGKAAAQEPRLIDIRWGNPKAPKITLVGKGVCFDTGGLDLKPAINMREMKKDMAGAAHVLGLARLIMLAKLPVCLRILIPAVENSIGANSYHPGDIIRTRGGLSVEIDNTDAEGRLILCDALSEAVSENPAYLFDFATLTGAAVVALGPEMPAMYSNDEQFAIEMLEASQRVKDQMWRMPLYNPYRDYLKSDIADMLNSSKLPIAGSITAALYLQTFIPRDIRWMHFDFYAANIETKPGRPLGGEAMVIRAVFDFLCTKFKER